jgi:hypothetical protein
LDESVTQSITAGVVVFLGVLWSLWGAWWLRRVELRREHEATVRALGLAWAREGWGPSVAARGDVAGRPVEVRWRRAFFGETARVRVGGAWALLPEGTDLRAHLAGGEG